VSEAEFRQMLERFPPDPKFIRFGFYYATELPDPEGLLEVSTTHRVPPLPPE
jgi:hypothetical protein